MSTIQTFDFSVDILRSLLWRNNDAINLTALMQAKQDFFNSESEDFWTSWLADVFDLRTANTFGLGVWSIILGLNITFAPPPPAAPNTNFGFGPFRVNYFGSNFAPSIDDTALSNDDARMLLRLRYYQLTTGTTIPDINAIMKDIFGDQGLVHVEDGLDMTINYVFSFAVASSTALVLVDFDIMPRPAGVSATIAFA